MFKIKAKTKTPAKVEAVKAKRVTKRVAWLKLFPGELCPFGKLA